MSREFVDCKGIECQYFRRYYDVIKIGKGLTSPRSNYMPDLNSIDKRCKHPIHNSKEGIRLFELRKCPNE